VPLAGTVWMRLALAPQLEPTLHLMRFQRPAEWQASGLPLGAKLGAIHCGFAWTGVDAGGRLSLPLRPVWTLMDIHGHRLEIYGSEGWGFESLQACCRDPLDRKGFAPAQGTRPSDVLEPFVGRMASFSRRGGQTLRRH